MRVLLVAGALCVLGIIAFALSPQGIPTSHTITQIKAGTYTCPANPTLNDLKVFNRAATKHQALPTGWQLAHDEGTVKLTDTGFAIPGTGERAWTVTVFAPHADLSTATAYINGQSVGTATRANGGIIDRGTMSLASLSILVPPSGQAWSGKIEWVADSGKVREWDSTFH